MNSALNAAYQRYGYNTSSSQPKREPTHQAKANKENIITTHYQYTYQPSKKN